ncbi:hypothetical protein [Pseudoxanthobacter sp.]|uniref:hypothetical protein n=1 Tax=Pseudoxanthobacter sp. TaxID=1925742 RepID=UPI002FE22DE5
MKSRSAKLLTTLAAVVMAGSALAACQSTISNKEDLLSAAGFTPKVASSPAQIKQMATLPPHKFTQLSKNGKTFYVYPDPTVCKCLYVGNQQSFESYQQMAFQQHLANEQTMAAMINQQVVEDEQWDWGPWGGPWGGAWGYW